MIFGSFPVDACVGGILAHGLGPESAWAGRRLPKGHRLETHDIDMVRQAGITHLTVALPEDGDIPEKEAATRLGHALAGAHVATRTASKGRVDLVACADGLVQIDAAAITRINAVDEAIAIATCDMDTPVTKGDIIANIKIIPYALAENILNKALMICQPIHVAPFHPRNATLIHTQLAVPNPKVEAATTGTTRARLARLGTRLQDIVTCAHDPQALAEALRAAKGDLVLIAGAVATTDRNDVTPRAIRDAGGEVLRVGLPVDPGNLLVFGRMGERLIIGMPGCARSPKRNGLDRILERAAADLEIDPKSFAGWGVGGLLSQSNTGHHTMGQTRRRKKTA